MGLTGEALSFLYACLLGAGMGVIYDCFRLMRLVSGNRVVVFFEDLLFSAICTLATLIFCIGFCAGKVRLYALVGEGLGFLIYHFTVGELVIRLLRAVISFMKALFFGIYKVFVFPIWKAACFFAQKTKKIFVSLLQCFGRMKKVHKFPLQEPDRMLYNEHNRHVGQNKDGVQQNENKEKQGESHC